jgi:hypothetical protein
MPTQPQEGGPGGGAPPGGVWGRPPEKTARVGWLGFRETPRPPTVRRRDIGAWVPLTAGAPGAAAVTSASPPALADPG